MYVKIGARIQESGEAVGWAGQVEGSRFNACTQTRCILPHNGLPLGNVKAGGFRELPRAML
jgi:hypothetical protein